MHDFISGALVTGFAVIALFFLRFWRRTGDRLFALFSFAFTLMALNRLILAIADLPENGYPLIYLVRLLANVVIIFAVVDKNRSILVGSPRQPRVTGS